MRKDPHILGLRLPPDLRQWIRNQSSRMHKTETEIATELLIYGLQTQTIQQMIAGIRSAGGFAVQRETLRQTLANRYIIELLSKGGVRHPETLGTDAQLWANRELEKLFPKGEDDDHQQKR